MKTDQFTAGILAHVDAGKTTLAEDLLYLCGKIRKIGRVDHGDAFFDNFEMERERGITIFSKYAPLSIGNRRMTLLDTPGHVDFSAETERAVSVMDYAILVISGVDGVQSHTRTLWEILDRYRVPVFLFVNKMDREGTDREALLVHLQKELSENCVDFTDDTSDDFYEAVAMCDEEAMETVVDSGSLEKSGVSDLILQRKVFPCYFGSALKQTGVQEFLDGLDTYVVSKDYPDAFGARVYKIARDDRGKRLTFLKVTGGSLKVREQITDSDGKPHKVSQIRIYAGERYEAVQEVQAGCLCAVTGLESTFPGQGFGFEKDAQEAATEAVISCQLILPEDCNAHEEYLKLQQLAEEEPQLRMEWNDRLQEIRVHLMGDVQTEVLKKLIADRFGLDVEFGPGHVVYRETLAEPVIGIGHFEPLRHYAEVHLLLEPGARGSGIIYETRCDSDLFNRNWQKQVLSHLRAKNHVGVLTGSPVTDLRITLLAGRAHVKHSEGADFREAAWRAVRNGMRKGKSLLLEPYYAFRLEIPSDCTGRAMTDLESRSARQDPPETDGDTTVIEGKAPVAVMQDYAMEVTAYSGGKGNLQLHFSGYDICHNPEEVIAQTGYDSEGDLDNPASSIFCEHGAGVYVGWEEVEAHAHIKPDQYPELPESLQKDRDSREKSAAASGRNPGLEEVSGNDNFHTGGNSGTGSRTASVSAPSAFSAEDKELEEIFARTYKVSREKQQADRLRAMQPAARRSSGKPAQQREKYLLVDGYNIIFAWSGLTELSKINLDSARQELMDILSNYQGYLQAHLILVFDAWKVRGGVGSVTRYHNIDVVFTREAETADSYIERVTHELGKKNDVTVATSDGLEQMIIWGHGARRLSAQELKADIEKANIEIAGFLAAQTSEKNRLFDHLDEKDKKKMEDVRLGRKKFSEK